MHSELFANLNLWQSSSFQVSQRIKRIFILLVISKISVECMGGGWSPGQSSLFRYRALYITIITSPTKQMSGELKGSFKPFINSVLSVCVMIIHYRFWSEEDNHLSWMKFYPKGWLRRWTRFKAAEKWYFMAEGTACGLLLVGCMCPRFPWLRRWTRFKAAEPPERRYFMAEGTACCLLAPNWRSIYIFTWPAASQHNPNLLDFHLFLHIQSWEKYNLEEYNFKLQFQ